MNYKKAIKWVCLILHFVGWMGVWWICRINQVDLRGQFCALSAVMAAEVGYFGWMTCVNKEGKKKK